MSDSEIEIKPIEGYEGLYSVTSEGNVISHERRVSHGTVASLRVKEKVLKPIKTKAGYLAVNLYKDGTIKSHHVHRLVAMTHLPPPLEGQTVVRHKEGDQSKNAKNDLEWGTHADNVKDKIRHGTWPTGEKNGRATSTDEEVRRIKERLKAGESCLSLAKELNLPKDKLYQIASNKTWTHVTV